MKKFIILITLLMLNGVAIAAEQGKVIAVNSSTKVVSARFGNTIRTMSVRGYPQCQLNQWHKNDIVHFSNEGIANYYNIYNVYNDTIGDMCKVDNYYER